ncbi:MAG TPA: hypothetical protein VLI04_17770 [Nocardioidaceae bacterium]|nr:hypothetical protein [Nocardioidaceae bacterium]
MPDDVVEVIGVHRVPDVPDAYLLEIRSARPPDELHLEAFTQEYPEQPRETWQAPWMERWLDPSGERVLTDEFAAPPAGLTESRLVFFLHFPSFDRPLLTPMGPAPLPVPTDIPDRLSAVHYRPVD